MKTLQIYETTIIAETSQHAAHIVVLPSRSFREFNSDMPVGDILPELGMRLITAQINPSNITRALAVALSSSVSTEEVDQLLVSASNGKIEMRSGVAVVAASDLTFAEVVGFDDVIPIEQSPLKAEALVTLVTKASGAGVGAFVGFVAFGASPMLLVTVPAGMIICGAAKGVSDALEAGLREKLLQWLKGKNKGKKTQGGKESSKKD
ncbi:hypothetical protein [Nitrospira sp. Nam80]